MEDCNLNGASLKYLQIIYIFQGVCGSLTNFFRLKVTTRDNAASTSEPQYAVPYKECVPTDFGSINMGLGPNDDEMTLALAQEIGGEINQNGGSITPVDEMRVIENTSVFFSESNDVNVQMSSQMSTLDNLISQADRAQSSLQHQNKQLRSFMR